MKQEYIFGKTFYYDRKCDKCGTLIPGNTPLAKVNALQAQYMVLCKECYDTIPEKEELVVKFCPRCGSDKIEVLCNDEDYLTEGSCSNCHICFEIGLDA